MDGPRFTMSSLTLKLSSLENFADMNAFVFLSNGAAHGYEELDPMRVQVFTKKTASHLQLCDIRC